MRAMRHGVRIHRVRTTRFGRGTVPGRMVDYLSFYITAFVALLRVLRRGDILVAKTDPPLISVPAAMAARMRGAILVNWLQDLFPEVGAALGIGAASGARGRVLRWLRNRSLRHARHNVTICDAMQQRLCREGIPPARISVIENWADTAIAPVAREENPLRRAWNLTPESLVIAYSGNLGRAHMPARVAELVRRTADIPGLVWLFIGGGAGIERLKTDPALGQSGRVLFKPYQPRERLCESLSVGDAHLIVLDPQCDGLILPSKYYGVRAVARPILYLGSSEASVAGMLDDGDVLLLAQDSDAWAGAIRGWMENRVAGSPRPSAAVDTAQKLDIWHSLLVRIASD